MILYQSLMIDKDFKQFYDKNNLKLSYTKNVNTNFNYLQGSMLTQKFILGKAIYKINKNTLNPCIKLENIVEIVIYLLTLKAL